MAGVSGMGTPDSLKPTVPQGPDISVPDLAMKGVPAPQMQAGVTPPMEAPPIDFDALFAEVNQPEIDFDAIFDEVQNEPGENQTKPILNQIADIGEDVLFNYTGAGKLIGDLMGRENKAFTDEAKARLFASFGVTDKEKQDSLEKSFGKGNVRKYGGDFEFKKDGKWVKLDPSDYEIVGDLADMARDFVEQGVTEVATAGGLLAATGEVAAAPLTGGTSIFAVPGTVAGARAMGGAAGLGAGDLIQKFLDIPRDEDRSAVKEYALATTFNALAGRLGDYASMRLLDRAGKAAVKIAEAPEVAFKNDLGELSETSQILTDMNLLPNIPGMDTPLMLNQIAAQDSRAKQLVEKVAGTPEYNQIVVQQGEVLGKTWTDYIKSLGKTPGVDLGETISSSIEAAQKAEGKFIGSIRDKVISEAGKNTDLPVKNLQAGITKMMDDLGFSVSESGKIIPPDADRIAELGFTSANGEKTFLRLVEEINEKVFNQEGRLTMPELMGFYQRFSKVTDSLYAQKNNVDYVYRNKMTNLKNLVRDELTEKINVIMPDSGYKESLARFSESAKASEEIQRILDRDNISSKAFAQKIFTGIDARNNFAQMKVLTKDKPDLMEQLKGQWISQVIEKSEGDTYRISRELLKDPELARDVFGDKAKEVVGAIGDLSKRLNETTVAPAGGKANIGLMKSIATAAGGGGIFANASAAAGLLSQVDTNKVLLQIVRRDGIDNFLKTAPKSSKSFLKKALEQYLKVQDNIGKYQAPLTRELGKEFAKPEEDEVP